MKKTAVEKIKHYTLLDNAPFVFLLLSILTILITLIGLFFAILMYLFGIIEAETLDSASISLIFVEGWLGSLAFSMILTMLYAVLWSIAKFIDIRIERKKL